MSLLDKITTSDYIHVIDDFYQDLGWLDQHLKHADFKEIQHVNYPGLSSLPPADISLVMERIKVLLGGNIQFVPHDGQVRVTRKKDQGLEKTRIHTDEGRIIILIYLSEVPEGLDPVACGTSFFRHKRIRKTRFTPMDPVRDEIQRNQVFKDTKKIEEWEKWMEVPFKKNRALIYDGNLYHSPPEQFYGSDLYTGRITQHFFPIHLKS